MRHFTVFGPSFSFLRAFLLAFHHRCCRYRYRCYSSFSFLSFSSCLSSSPSSCLSFSLSLSLFSSFSVASAKQEKQRAAKFSQCPQQSANVKGAPPTLRVGCCKSKNMPGQLRVCHTPIKVPSGAVGPAAFINSLGVLMAPVALSSPYS